MTVEKPDTFPIAVIAEGDNKQEISIVSNVDIPVSTLDDTLWAQAFLNTSWSLTGGVAKNMGKKFSDAVEAGHLWRVEYAFNYNKQSDVQFISSYIGRNAFNEALRKGHREVVDFLLSKDCISNYGYSAYTLYQLANLKYKDILEDLVQKGKIDINAHEQEVLYSAIDRIDEEMSLFVLSLGGQYNHAQTRYRNEENCETKKNILERVIKKFKSPDFDPKTIFDKKPEPKELEAPKTQWEAIDDNIIVKHTEIKSTNTKIQTMFNFVARDVSTIVNSNPDVPSTVVIRNFKDIEDERVLFDAWQALKDAGKKPHLFTGNDNFRVHKPERKQKITIENP